ncbi:hypothetical protein [Sandaracinus amylolyticus]|uniref:hypothetical protein n=1 Tax=Sandaracinus amylolyticus TaxID=927083 RepID=UPI001F3C4F35|nr:hypothetical protein [Sandaracinus amylolyticus]
MSLALGALLALSSPVSGARADGPPDIGPEVAPPEALTEVVAEESHEDDDEEEEDDDEGDHEAPRGTRPPDRPVPDYDGLPERGDDAGDVFLWTARVLTSPLYLVSEYVLRRPIGWALTELERHKIIERLVSFFRFGPNNEITLMPTFLYEFGFQPSIGIYGSWDDFLFDHNHISIHGVYGGNDWLSGTIADRIEVAQDSYVGARFLARERPDYVFGGIGPNATDGPRARYGAVRYEPVLWSSVRYWQSSDLQFEMRYRSIEFFDNSWGDDPSVLERQMETGQLVPYGYLTGYETVSTEMIVDLDTRTPRAPPEGGARIAAHAGIHGAFGGLPELDRWVSWGGSGTLAADVLGGHRVIGITGEAHLISPLDDSNVPFTELVELGGSRGLLPGYRAGDIQGYSAVGLLMHYEWPIWAFLDSRLYFGTANAFGRYFEDFDVELLRLTFGLELKPRFPVIEAPFTFNFGFATETFERGANIDSFRIEIGARDAL